MASQNDQAGQKTTTPDVTAGELFTVVLLTVLPTTLNGALQNAALNGRDLSAGLETEIATNKETDGEAADQYRSLVADARFKDLFEKFVNDDDFILASKKVAESVFAGAGATGIARWSAPPHPRRLDIGRLQDYLKTFLETDPG